MMSTGSENAGECRCRRPRGVVVAREVSTSLPSRCRHRRSWVAVGGPWVVGVIRGSSSPVWCRRRPCGVIVALVVSMSPVWCRRHPRDAVAVRVMSMSSMRRRRRCPPAAATAVPGSPSGCLGSLVFVRGSSPPVWCRHLCAVHYCWTWEAKVAYITESAWA